MGIRVVGVEGEETFFFENEAFHFITATCHFFLWQPQIINVTRRHSFFMIEYIFVQSFFGIWATWKEEVSNKM
jgi:hypothetical protein